MLIILTLLYCFQPCFACGYRHSRKHLGIALKEILMAPFGRVRFRDFFLADVITSAGVPLNDIGYVSYYLFNLNNTHNHSDAKDIAGIKVYFTIMTLLPSWFRMMQCLNKFKNSGMKIHLANFGKYTSKFWVGII